MSQTLKTAAAVVGIDIGKNSDLPIGRDIVPFGAATIPPGTARGSARSRRSGNRHKSRPPDHNIRRQLTIFCG